MPYSRSPKYEVSCFLPEMNTSYNKSTPFCGSHLEYFSLPKGENSTPTWMLLHISQREIISKEKNFIDQSRVTLLSCRTISNSISTRNEEYNLNVIQKFDLAPGNSSSKQVGNKSNIQHIQCILDYPNPRISEQPKAGL